MITEEMKAWRMREDVDKILDVESWPRGPLRLKTQPWIEKREFGFVSALDLRTVHVQNLDTFQIERDETYPSVEKMVETWSVD